MDFSMSIAEPVDAVVTWVNGNEPVHRAKRLLYSQNAEQNVADFALTDWRFIDAGEVRYSIYSIRKFTPWIRNIYLVTDNQQPAWLTEDLQKRLNVKTIDHTIIFHDHLDCLPTFNNMSIGFLLFRIPGLANRYITFNDDNFIITPVTIDDFFIENKPVIRGKWYPQKKGLVKKMKRFVKH